VKRRRSNLWGGAQALLQRVQRFGWVDLLAILALAGLLFGLIHLAREWSGQRHVQTAIDLSPWALPRYTFFSLSRGLIAYGLSLFFTFLYGYWAAKDRIAERVLIPLLDILQSIPVLGFMPVVLLALVGFFPAGSNFGPELASIILIFTGQVWNMTFSFYHSLRSVPPEQQEAATVYHFTWWQRLKWLEVPFATMGLVWNSMMSMAGGWFFLMVTEAYRLGDEDFRVPGLGSYMSAAVDARDVSAQLWGITAMILMIVALDQLLWRPVIVWAQKYRVEEGGAQEQMSSWVLSLLRRSRILPALSRGWRRLQVKWEEQAGRTTAPSGPRPPAPRWAALLSLLAFAVLLIGLGYGTYRVVLLLTHLPAEQWADIAGAGGLTLGRVVLSLILGTAWALPAGLVIGLSPRLSYVLQPVVQILASFPAPMLFPLVIAALEITGVSLGWGSVLLMLLGTQWYILFNVIAGAMAVPADLREAARSYRISGLRRFWTLYAPAVFPFLVTGWVTAAGGAWNASIIAEYTTYRGRVVDTTGLGAAISRAADQGHFAELAAGVLAMSLLVVLFNRLVWKRLYRLAEERFSLAK
jgi:NitT/TauT family transport system permease protein